MIDVSAGRRITLTHNLYHLRRDEMSRAFFRPEKLPLYNIVCEMLGELELLKQGKRDPQHSTDFEKC